MAFRRNQVEKIKRARIDFIAANGKRGTREDRARANAVLNSLLRSSSEEETRQAYRELPNS